VADIVISGVLTRGEAAKRIGVTAIRVDQLVSSGRLRPSIITPHGRLFGEADVARLVAERAAKNQ